MAITVFDQIVKLSKQLFPRGRVFRMPTGRYFEGLVRGLAESERRYHDDSVSVLNSVLPDNEFFTADDATDWERRLGMIVSENVDLELRKLAILRKLQFPGQAKARQSQVWFQGQLQAAGFNVYVYENLTNESPYDVSGDPSILSDIEYGMVDYGEEEYGSYFNNKIVNFIHEGFDDHFNEGGSYRASMIIGGSVLGSFAEVSTDRKDEFRQLILRLKPSQFVIYLFVNYNY